MKIGLLACWPAQPLYSSLSTLSRIVSFKTASICLCLIEATVEALEHFRRNKSACNTNRHHHWHSIFCRTYRQLSHYVHIIESTALRLFGTSFRVCGLPRRLHASRNKPPIIVRSSLHREYTRLPGFGLWKWRLFHRLHQRSEFYRAFCPAGMQQCFRRKYHCRCAGGKSHADSLSSPGQL